MQNTRLRTQLQVATRRAQVIAKAHARDEWRSRLDAASYTCHREGAAWVAEGPAKQRFDYSRTATGDVLCLSSSGGIYLLTVTDGETVCDCKARRQASTCKHEMGFAAVKMAHKMERQQVRTELHSEARGMEADACAECGVPAPCPCEYRDYVPGSELDGLREAAEEAARRCRAEVGAANGAGR